MPVQDTGLVNNSIGTIASVNVSLSNTGNLPATVGLELYNIIYPSGGFGVTQILFTTVFNLNAFGLSNSSFTYPIPTSSYSSFGVRVLTNGPGADNIVLNVTALDATGLYKDTILFGESPSTLYMYVGADSIINVYDVATNQLTTNITLPALAKAIAVNAIGTRAYVADSNGTVSVIQTSTNSIIATIPGFSSVSINGLAVTPNLLTLYVLDSSFGSTTLDFCSTITNTVSGSLSLGSISANSMAMTTDGQYLYVCNSGGNAIIVISTATNTISTTIDLSTTGISLPLGVTMSADGLFAYVLGQNGFVVIINTSSQSVSTTISAPVTSNNYSRISASPFAGTTLYIANSPGITDPPTLYGINTLTNQVYISYQLPASFNGDTILQIVVSADASKVYLTLQNNNLVAVIDVQQTPFQLSETFATSSTPFCAQLTPIFLDFSGLGN